jgi:hypothetical protein
MLPLDDPVPLALAASLTPIAVDDRLAETISTQWRDWRPQHRLAHFPR